MALKRLMLQRSIELKRQELAALQAKDADFLTREQELEAAINEATTPEDQDAVTRSVEAYDADFSAHNSAKDALETEIGNLEADLAAEEAKKPNLDTGDPNRQQETTERRIPMSNFNIRSLPLGQRVFDAMPAESRAAILQRDDAKAFLAQIRSMRGQTRAITGAELMIPVVYLDLISENVYRYSKLLRHIRVRSVKGEARQTISGIVEEAVWMEMCGALNELNFGFNQITLDGYKVGGFIAVCNAILEDSDLALSSWIVEAISESIGLALDKAILYGKGSAGRMPLGIVTRLAQTQKPSDYPANAPEWVDLHTSNILKISADLTGAAFWSALMLATGNTYTRYSRGDQVWSMNSKTYALLRSKVITFTATGDLASSVFGYLPIIGGTVEVLEFIPDGDIIGGYGELYLLLQRSGMTIEASREVQFIQDNTVFRGKQRADGAPVIPGAFVAININGTDVTTTIPFAADTANDANLDSLEGLTLSPSFDAKILTYAATASAASNAISATPAQASASVAISYNGKNVRNGGSVTWLADGAAHPLTVTVRNGNAVRVYTVNVTKAAADG
ncbi:MAG TPA: phage major capsid protein [Candidatus Faecousia intestinigallinarum]|nr:phage major capsid protein [Candidatus Faecousia intestinigallinarum]